MKSFLQFLAISLLPILSASFSVSSIRRRVRIGRQHLAASLNGRPDASAAIQEALAVSKTYGPTSPEARLAWEAVEEMDASRSSSTAMKLGTDIEECDVEAPSDDCLEYGSQLDELEALISEAASSVNAVESPMMDPRWENVSPLPMPKPDESRVVIESPILHQAVVAARAASATYGLTSPEATLAWEEVEEIYHSYEKQEALGGKINFDEECQTEMLEACEALEELHRALKLGE